MIDLMKKGLLIIISGPPCSGKSTIAQKISSELHIPLYTRDMFKEVLFDNLDWDWSQGKAQFDKIGYIANENLFQITEEEMKAGRSILLENVFHPFYNKIFQDMQARIPFNSLELNVRASGEILEKRHKKRAKQKHAGHGSLQTYQYKAVLDKGYVEPLDLGGEVVVIDTSNWDTVNMASITSRVASKLP